MASAPKLPADKFDIESRKGLPLSSASDNSGKAEEDKFAPPLVGPGGRRKRRTRRRGGFVLQDPNLRSGPAPVGPQGPLGGRRRRTRKHKSRKHTRRH
jgi:hypothetical protein